MSNFPHSQLFIGKHRTVVISGPHIQILDTNTGNILHSTVSFDHHAKDAILKSGNVRCSAVDVSVAHLVTNGDDKILKVWQLDGLKLLSSRELPKKPTSIQFTRNGQTLLVSDKFGDIFSYPLHWTLDPSRSEELTSKRDAVTSHENPSGGTLILGHASLLTSFTLSADERYIISADRDEHIRVSWYPQGWNVEMYCLGHEKYVSSVHLPVFAPQTLISAGGDPKLKLWDWMNGKVIAEVQIRDIVQGFIKVRALKNERIEQDEGDDKLRRKRGKEWVADQGGKDNMDERDGEASPSSNGGHSTGGQTQLADGSGALVQVVHKIDTFEIGPRRYIFFSVVGATAIFWTLFPLDVVSSSSSDMHVHYFDFRQPVLDFISRGSGLIWVLLDGESYGIGEGGRMVQSIQWDSNADEFNTVEKSSESALLASLNSTCLLPATPAELKSLDLYAPLLSLPKNSAGDPDGGGSRISPNSKKEQKDQLAATKRQLGRLKNKIALAKAMEARKLGGAGGSKDEEQEKREHKRSKSEIAEYGDVVMDEA